MNLITRSSSLQTYLQHREEIRKILDTISVKQPTYENLEWRADVQVWRPIASHHDPHVPEGCQPHAAPESRPQDPAED